jgi:phosphatidate cytidylyltransferase
MKRLITATGLLIAALYLIWWAPQAVFLGAALAVALLGYREYSDLVSAHSVKRPGLFGAAMGILILFWPEYRMPDVSFVAGLTLLVICAFVRALRFPDLRDILPYAACTVLGAFYTFAPWRFAIVLRQESVHLLFFALALNWAGDTAAYYIGRRFGKHPLAPMVSPNKSWEGAIGSVVGSLIFGLLYLGRFMPQIPLWQIAVMAITGNAAGQLGDLAESAIKRGAGVKDSGTLLPGHGGFLDRVDSTLFALPVIYFVYRLAISVS